MGNTRGVNVSRVTIEEAKAVYDSLLQPTDQAVVDALHAAGRGPTDRHTIGKWRRKGWVQGRRGKQPHPGPEDRIFEASRRLDAAAPMLTGNAETRAHTLAAQLRQELASLPMAAKIQMVLNMNADCLIRIQQILEGKLDAMMADKPAELVALQTVCVKNAAILAEANRINHADSMKLIEAPRNGRVPDTIDNHPFAAELAALDAVE